ncbi:MAG TPA: MlaD family protein [Bacteroidales bacterium]|nr:MlaD family protein [Bacteroidales bacterium]
MKISNEVKIGATVVITLVIFIWLYNFLKGKNFFQNVAYYYSVYDNIGGLSESNPVEVNGYKVGVVQSLDFLDESSGKIIVEFSVDRDFRLPRNTVAEVTPISLLGGMKVQFVYGNGPGFYSEGDTIPGRVAPSLAEMVRIEFQPLKEKFSSLIVTMDSVTSSLDQLMNEDFKSDIGITADNLKNTSGSLKNIIGSKETDLAGTIENLNKFSKMLSQESEGISSTLRNIENITDTLAAADIYSTLVNLKSSLQQTTLTLEKINEGKGTAGQLISNDTLYSNLSNSLESLNILLTDVKANPKRYVHFSIFGKKGK